MLLSACSSGDIDEPDALLNFSWSYHDTSRRNVTTHLGSFRGVGLGAAAVDGACFNAGQSCCGIERVYVHRSKYDAFLEAARAECDAYVLGDPADAATTQGPLGAPGVPKSPAPKLSVAAHHTPPPKEAAARRRMDSPGRRAKAEEFMRLLKEEEEQKQE